MLRFLSRWRNVLDASLRSVSGLVLYVVPQNPTAPVEWLNDSYKVILSCVCVGVTCNKLWLDYPFIWLWFILVEEPSSKMPSCNDVILHSDEDHCSIVIGSLCRVCSQWHASFVYRLVAGRRFPLEDPVRTIVGCIWLYELQNKFDESYMDSYTWMMSAACSMNRAVYVSIDVQSTIPVCHTHSFGLSGWRC